MNYGLSRVIGENETGGRIQSDEDYRREAWAFVLAGGALFSHLDYSFSVGHEDGTFVYPRAQPGGGSAALRRQLGVLADFMRGFDLLRMTPQSAEAIAGKLPEGVGGFVLAERGRQVAAYFCRTADKVEAGTPPTTVSLSMPMAAYRVQWLDPISGRVLAGDTSTSPPFGRDIALRALAR